MSDFPELQGSIDGELIFGIQGPAGKDGKDGYTPVKGVDYFDGKDGQDGKNGLDGSTPVRGKDYWTDADKQEILNDAFTAAEDRLPPAVSAADNGKIMEVKNGKWVPVTVSESSVKTFVDEYISSALEGDY